MDSKRKDRWLCWYVDDWNKSFKNLDRCFSWGSPTATSGKSCPQMFVDHVSKFSVVSNTKVASWPRSSKRPQPPLLSDYKVLSVLRVLGMVVVFALWSSCEEFPSRHWLCGLTRKRQKLRMTGYGDLNSNSLQTTRGMKGGKDSLETWQKPFFSCGR